MSNRKTWMDRTLAGEVVDVDDEIAAWRETDTALDLAEWLGMTDAEYDAFATCAPHALSAIVALRRETATAAANVCEKIMRSYPKIRVKADGTIDDRDARAIESALYELTGNKHSVDRSVNVAIHGLKVTPA